MVKDILSDISDPMGALGMDDPSSLMGGASNLFKEVLADPKAAEEKYIGPDYPYYKYIKTPSELGMSGTGSLTQLGKDIDGLKAYVALLVSGKSNASATGQPLGNKFFLQTGAKCTDTATGQEVDRFVYINNVPQGRIPFISQGMGVNFSEFKGLIPGTISNLNAFNPMGMFQAFLAGAKPPCRSLTMETIDTNNNRSTQTNFVTITDIKSIDPCSFQDKRNPETDETCRETFTNINDTSLDTQCYTCFKIPEEPLSQAYMAALSVLGVYILYRFMVKNSMLPSE